MAKITVDGVRYELSNDTMSAKVGAVEHEHEFMKSYTIPETVTADGFTYKFTKIGAKALNECSKLEKVIIPDSVTEIEGGKRDGFGCNVYSAFSGCTRLESITLPNKLTIIGPGVFRGCTNLTSIVIPSKVRLLGCEAFKDCANLKSIIIENVKGAVEFGQDALQNTCATIRYVGVPQKKQTMIKVKMFSITCRSISNSSAVDKCIMDLENSINEWFDENHVEVIEIKYSTTCSSGGTSDIISWIPSAMLIYKEKQD